MIASSHLIKALVLWAKASIGHTVAYQKLLHRLQVELLFEIAQHDWQQESVHRAGSYAAVLRPPGC